MNDTTFQGDGKITFVPVVVNAKKPKQTNADLIRQMSDEELAEFIGGDPMHDICPNNCHEDPERPCAVCILDWLKQEAT